MTRGTLDNPIKVEAQDIRKKGRNVLSRAGRLLRSEDSAFFSPIEAYEAIASSYIVVNGVYLLSDLLRGRRAINSMEEVSSSDYTPFTSIIIPTYNEPEDVVTNTINSMRALDYPGYEIILADDSTVAKDYGQDVKVVRRQNREGFKGGAMRNALGHVDPRSELIAIFDADFTVEKDALRQFARHFTDPKVGAVQGYIKISANEDTNGLTKFISTTSSISNYILYGRYVRRGFVAVQGANEVYSKDAIDDLGGIAPYTTVNEDLDTSFRMRMKGWKIVYDPGIVGIGLAPVTYKKFAGQLSRWTSSTIREYRRHMFSFLKSGEVKIKEKVDSLLFLSTWTISLVVSPTLFMLPVVLLTSHLPYSAPLSAVMAALPTALILSAVDLKTDLKTAAKSLAMYFWFLLPGYFVSFRAVVQGLTKDGSFNVTDKNVAVKEEALTAKSPEGLKAEL